MTFFYCFFYFAVQNHPVRENCSHIRTKIDILQKDTLKIFFKEEKCINFLAYFGSDLYKRVTNYKRYEIGQIRAKLHYFSYQQPMKVEFYISNIIMQ